MLRARLDGEGHPPFQTPHLKGKNYLGGRLFSNF